MGHRGAVQYGPGHGFSQSRPANWQRFGKLTATSRPDRRYTFDGRPGAGPTTPGEAAEVVLAEQPIIHQLVQTEFRHMERHPDTGRWLAHGPRAHSGMKRTGKGLAGLARPTQRCWSHGTGRTSGSVDFFPSSSSI